MWDGDDLATLQRAAAAYDEMLGQCAAVTVVSLRWIKERVDQVKATPPQRGVDWETFPWEKWVSECKGAFKNLNKIWKGALKTEGSP